MFWQVPPLHWASIGVGFDFACTVSYELATNQTWKMCMNQVKTTNMKGEFFSFQKIQGLIQTVD